MEMKKEITFALCISVSALTAGTMQGKAEPATGEESISTELGATPTPHFEINKSGETLATRFINKDPDWTRPYQSEYAQWLLNLDVYPNGHESAYYDKITKDIDSKIFLAVLKFDLIGEFDKNGKEKPADLQQCADACMRIRAEYLWQTKQYEQIHFKSTDGFIYDYAKWGEGYRIHYDTNRKAYWQKDLEPNYDYVNFRKFLSLTFKNCGTLSLSKELEAIKPTEVQPGDILIFGGCPGHSVTVMDVQQNKKTGTIRVMFSQSYMPAQEIEILANWEQDFSPWFEIDSDEIPQIKTPQWKFDMRKGSKFMRWTK